MNIRLFNGEGVFGFDHLVRIASPFLKLDKIESTVGVMIVKELYFELVKRNEIKPIEELSLEERKEIWKKAKQTGETDKGRLVMISHGIYLKKCL